MKTRSGVYAQLFPFNMMKKKFAIVGLVRGQSDGNYVMLILRNQYVARYLKKFPYPSPDVIIFHQGNIRPKHQREIIQLSGMEMQFINIGSEFDSWKGTCGPQNERWPIGYCHMCRFYFQVLPKIMALQGYDYYMRLDDDSMLLRSRFNIFDFMIQSGIDYGAIGTDNESHSATNGTLPKTIAAYAQQHGLKFKPSIQMFYNNFFVTRTDAWNHPRVQKFLNTFGNAPELYRYRWGDALLQTAAIQLFRFKAAVIPGIHYFHASHNRTVKTPPSLRIGT